MRKVEGGDEDFREGEKKRWRRTWNCISAAFSGEGARARLVKVEQCSEGEKWGRLD